MKILKMKLITIIIATAGLAAAPALLAQGCCRGGGPMKEGCNMGGTPTSGSLEAQGAGGEAAESAPVKPVFSGPVQSVFDDYIKVQGALAQDSLEGVSDAGSAMAKAIQGDPARTLSPRVAQQALALAKAKDLEAARGAFKSLSDSLIQFVKGQKAAAGTYHVAYCPMANASWLQTGKTVINPYMGKAMLHCGQLKT
jgi:hypothetical protein